MHIAKGNPLVMGVTKVGTGYNFSVSSMKEELVLNLYPLKGSGKKKISITLDKTYKVGGVFSVFVDGYDMTHVSYDYSYHDEHFTDPYGKSVSQTGEFGAAPTSVCTSVVELADFDWEGDTPPNIPYADSIIYKIHTRGYTKHKSSGVRNRGTFAGLVEKIPYLKELGITAVLLMPSYDFDETGLRTGTAQKEPAIYTEERHLNYWGYTGGNYFAVKMSYCADKSTDGSAEFKNMVKAFHKNGIEVLMEMFFVDVSSSLVLDCIRYWVKEYHIDGVQLYGSRNSLELVAEDAMLSDRKLITIYWEGKENPYSLEGVKTIANCNDGFMNAARRFLKGDEDQLQRFMHLVLDNPEHSANINYITTHTGFTMMDMVSYEYKHNEANGENNRDGENYNYSWNCGFEGATTKKKVNTLRISQLRNAWMLLLLAQGTPMWFGGDEFLNSQNGNNNPYCQDNEIGWVNWRSTIAAKQMTAFVKELIAFRKANKILHMERPMLQSDYRQIGFPDVSYHGDNAWLHAMENYKRYAGILYCSAYAKTDGSDIKAKTPASGKEKGAQLIYVAYNMHWEEHYLALPKSSSVCYWRVAVSSKPSEEITFAEDLRKVKIPPRCIVVLEGQIAQAPAKRSAAGRTGTGRKADNEKVK